MSKTLARLVAARTERRAHGFTLVELLVVIAIIALLISILLPSLVTARCMARQTQNVSNLKNLSTAVFNYGGDFKDGIAAFTWRANQTYQQASGINSDGTFSYSPVSFNSDLLASGAQALDIIRRRSQPECVGMPVQTNWIPHPTYSHLVLMDFLSARLPEPMLHNPSDKFRQNMSEEYRTAPNQLQYCLSLPGRMGDIRQTWPFSSSYQFAPASYMPDKEGYDGGFLRQGDDQIYYNYNGGTGRYRLGGRSLNEVIFPAQKVLLMEDVGRLDCKTEYPLFHPNANISVGVFDGQVRVLKMNEVNPGAYARPNGIRQAIALTYTPRTQWGYPLWPGGVIPNDLQGYCRWTYRGLRGIDFGGDEPPSGAW
ncbi:MAG: prepilin-type N-terminal cleavage/methylation domain-containing protein [Phycisphaerales bacterium]